MRYFQIAGNPLTFGYDETDPSQLAAMEAKFFTDGVLNSGVTEVTGNWPPAPTLDQVRAAQSALMTSACQNAIEAGFSSSALGSAYTYGCKPTGQANINLAAVGGGSLWCANSSNVWVFASHTVTEAQQVQKDMAAHIQAQQSTYAKALSDIAAATTVAAVEAVTWTAP